MRRALSEAPEDAPVRRQPRSATSSDTTLCGRTPPPSMYPRSGSAAPDRSRIRGRRPPPTAHAHMYSGAGRSSRTGGGRGGGWPVRCTHARTHAGARGAGSSAVVARSTGSPQKRGHGREKRARAFLTTSLPRPLRSPPTAVPPRRHQLIIYTLLYTPTAAAASSSISALASLATYRAGSRARAIAFCLCKQFALA